MAQILLLAVAAAFFPILLAAVLVILAHPEPEGQLAALLAGGMLVSLASGAAILLVLSAADELQSGGGSTSPAVDLILGAALVIGAGVAALRPPRPRDGPSWTERTLARGSRRLAFGAGIVLCLPNLYYLAALKDMSVDGYGTATLVVLLLAFNIIMFATAELPLVGFALAGDRTRAVVERFGTAVRAHQRQVVIVMAVLFGVYLVVKGLHEALT